MNATPPVRRQRRNRSQDLLGKLMTQTGPRTTAPMWVRPLLTVGEWAVYTALWSYPTDSVFPTHQDLADRAWCERGTAADAVSRFDELGLLAREKQQREDGSDTSNAYYLVEVCTPELAKKIEAKKAERAAEQEKKRKARKAKNRSYAAKTTPGKETAEAPGGGYGTDRTPLISGPDGGTAQTVPPGYGGESTSGGTAHAVPGYGVCRTHETLGVEVSTKGTVRTSPSPSAGKPAKLAAPIGAKGQEEEDPFSSKLQNQEPNRRDFHPTLTEWELALHAEVLPLRPDWTARQLKQAIGWPAVRERTAQNPELVRRAFLIGARDTAKPEKGYQGTWSPLRFTKDGCPHWAAAQAEIAAQTAADAGNTAEPGSVPDVVVSEPERPRRSPVPAGYVNPLVERTAPSPSARDLLARAGLVSRSAGARS